MMAKVDSAAIFANSEKLRILKGLPLDFKVEHAKERVEEFAEHVRREWDKGVYCSFSGGKDSTVLADIISKTSVAKDCPLVFSDTGLELPQIREFAKERGAEFIRPRKNIREVICEHGYPLISKQVAQKIAEARAGSASAMSRLRGEAEYVDAFGVRRKSCYNCEKYSPLLDLPVKISARCCNELKKRPFAVYSRTSGRRPYLGITTDEGRLRINAWKRAGDCNAYTAKSKAHSWPIAVFSEQDVLQYIKDNGLKIASCYGEITEKDGKLHCTGLKRTGCAFCGFGLHLERKDGGAGRLTNLKRRNPKIYEFCMDGGEFVTENGKRWFMPNRFGLGFARVFDMLNDVLSVNGKKFIEYE